jgi:CheY-like chemotaxis protein
MDENMPILNGSEVLKSFRKFELEHNLKPIFAISITGDPELGEVEKNLYDLMVRKPFNKQKVREAISKVK